LDHHKRYVYEDVINGLGDAAICVNGQKMIICYNSIAKRLFSALERDEPLSIAIRDPLVLDAVKFVIDNREVQERFYARRTPHEQFFDVRIAPLAQEDALICFRDSSASKALERMRVDFIANASHELRTPLTAIMGFIDTLDSHAHLETEQRSRFLGVMREQAQRMRRLINDLLSLSTIEVKAHLAPQERVDLVAIVREGLQGLAPLAQDAGVQIQFIAPKSPYLVAGDRDELIRVVDNLVENAIKYAGEGKRVEIELSTQIRSGREEMTLSVRDFGAGIPHEHLPRLTERFYRVDAAGSRARGGTGLGLAIVKHIIQRHQGRFEIHSEIGKGSVFSVIFPQKNA
jgi:two-component system, OmpR family, phosphate regulon sensor histidine kinase PhoR